jgi:hypothetical protein
VRTDPDGLVFEERLDPNITAGDLLSVLAALLLSLSEEPLEKEGAEQTTTTISEV